MKEKKLANFTIILLSFAKIKFASLIHYVDAQWHVSTICQSIIFVIFKNASYTVKWWDFYGNIHNLLWRNHKLTVNFGKENFQCCLVKLSFIILHKIIKTCRSSVVSMSNIDFLLYRHCTMHIYWKFYCILGYFWGTKFLEISHFLYFSRKLIPWNCCYATATPFYVST